MKFLTTNLRKFILNFFIFLSMIIIMDRMAGFILHHYYFTQTSGLNYSTTYALDSTTAEILVFGSSRAIHHYVPKIFEDSLNMSFYNTGRDGNFLLFNYAVFKSVVKRYTPKIVIFDINPDEFFENNLEYDRLTSLLPYVRKHPEFMELLERRSRYEKYKLASSIYPYNSLILTIGDGNFKRHLHINDNEKGYVSLHGSLAVENRPDTVSDTLTKIDLSKVKMMKEIINYCSIHKISIYLVTSPVYEVLVENSAMNTIKENIVNSSPFILDYSNYPLFIKTPGFFKDKKHLNATGSEEFSAILAHKIKFYMTY